MRYTGVRSSAWARGASAALLLGVIGCTSAPVTIDREAFLARQAPAGSREIDLGRLVAIVRGGTATGDYKLGPGDLLDVEIYGLYGYGEIRYGTVQPAKLRVRVTQEGKVNLPFVPEVGVNGMTADQAEGAIRGAYAKGILKNPRISVVLDRPATIKVAVLGAVKTPDIYELDRREQTLAHAIMKAGGPDAETATGKVLVTRGSKPAGSAATRADRTAGAGDEARGPGPAIEAYRLPFRASTEPFQDVPVQDGDSVLVEERPQPEFLVTGLVGRPGYYALPWGRDIDLYEALGYAGGIDPGWAPPYVRVQRRTDDGEYVCAEFDVREPEACSQVRVQPGDVISVRHTWSTRIRSFFAGFFHIGTGVYYYPIR